MVRSRAMRASESWQHDAAVYLQKLVRRYGRKHPHTDSSVLALLFSHLYVLTKHHT